MKIRSCSQRLLALVLAIVMVSSAVLPAAATDAPCTLTENCLLEMGHEGECQTQEPPQEPPQEPEETQPAESEPEETQPAETQETQPAETQSLEPQNDEPEPEEAAALDTLLALVYENGSFRPVTELAMTYDPSTGYSKLVEVAFAWGTADSYDLLNWDEFSASTAGAVTYGVNYYGSFDTLTVTTYDLTGYNYDGTVTVSYNGAQLSLYAYMDEPQFTSAAKVYAVDSEGNYYSALDFDLTFGTQAWAAAKDYRFVLQQNGVEFFLDSRHCDSSAQTTGYLNSTDVDAQGNTWFRVCASAIGCGELVFTYNGNSYRFPVNGVYAGPIDQSVYHKIRNWSNNRLYNFLDLEYDENAQTQQSVEFSFLLTTEQDSVFFDGIIEEIDGPISISEPKFEGNSPNAPAHYYRTATPTGTGEATVFVRNGNTRYSFHFNCVSPKPVSLYASEVGRDNLTNNPILFYSDDVQQSTTFMFKLGNLESGNMTNVTTNSISITGPVELLRTESVPNSNTGPGYMAFTLVPTGIGTGTVTYTDNATGNCYTMSIQCMAPVADFMTAEDLSNGMQSTTLTFLYDKGTGYSKQLMFRVGNDMMGFENITDASQISVSGKLEIIGTQFQDNTNWSPAFMMFNIVPTGTGRGTITCTQGNTSYTISVNCVDLEDYPKTELLGATPNANQINPKNPIQVLVRQGPPTEFALLVAEGGGYPTFLNDPSRITWDEDVLDVEPMYFREENGMGYQVYGITCSSFAGGNIYYTDEFGRVSTLKVEGISVDDLPVKELCLTDKGAYTPQDGISLVYNEGTHISEVREVSFWFGNFQTLEVEEVMDIARLKWGGVVEMELTGELWDGYWPVFRLSVNGIGEGWIQYTDPATGQTDKLYVYGVENPIRASSTDMLYTKTHAGDYYPALYTYFGPAYDNNGNLTSQPGSTFLQFYFGNPNGTNINLFPDNLKTTGPIRIAPMGQGSYYDEDQQAYVVKVEGTGFGKGTVEYTVDGITYCYLVTSQADWAPSWDDNGPSNGITVDYGKGNSDVTVGIGSVIGYIDGSYSDTDMLVLTANHGRYFDPINDQRDEHTSHLTLVALSNYGTNTQDTAPQSFYDAISDVSFEVMSWQNDYGWDYDEYPVPTTPTIRRDTAGITTWAMPKIWDQFHAFTAQIAMRFTLTLDGTPMRYTMVCNLEAHQSSSITVFADDLTTAARLNTVLGNMQIMENWLEDKFPEEYRRLSEDGDITIVLPAVTYESLIVDRAARRAPLTSNTTGLILIQGSTDAAGNRTTMPGLLSTTGTGTSAISNIDFVADEDVTMTYKGETFTCGFLIDPTSQTFADAYDHEYLAAYDKRYDGSADYIPNPRAGSEWFGETQQEHGGVISHCTFTGFDYGLRSTDNGYTGAANSCTFVDNEYAIHVDSGDITNSGGSGSALYHENTFRDNRWAVTLRNLPQDVTPYDMRFCDSIFEGNHKDFKVTTPGNKHYYYFYRNYYSGKSSDTMTLRSGDSQARSATIEVDGNGLPLTEPCRLTPDLRPSADNLWIFQDTGILNSEAGALLIPEAALPSRSLTVIDNESNDIAVWSFAD